MIAEVVATADLKSALERATTEGDSPVMRFGRGDARSRVSRVA